jgi:adenylosuccinate synthase
MKKDSINFVVDGQWGSCGKGLIAGYLAQHHKVSIASTNNLPNAGHTVILEDGSTFISKILPCSAFLNTNGQKVVSLIGPGAGFSIPRLQAEMEMCGIGPELVRIHPRAMVVTEKHAEIERGAQGTKHIASTMQGSGSARAEKIMRGANVKLARDFPELESMVETNWLKYVAKEGLLDNSIWLHEGSQGFSLGMNHGSHYPFCTSRECTVARELTDLGMPPEATGEVYLVIRPFPIRVGNVIEDGKQVGYSGDVYEDQTELSWAEIKEMSGYPEDYDLKEMTTVTKRLRRVFTFSMDQVLMAAFVNGATKIALNFANYLDYSCYGTNGNDVRKLPDKVRGFISELENRMRIPVSIVGTGPSVDHVWDFEV